MPLLRSNNNNNKTGSEATPMLGTLGNQINQYNTNSPEAGSDKRVGWLRQKCQVAYPTTTYHGILRTEPD